MDTIQLKHEVQPFRQFSTVNASHERLFRVAIELICMLNPGITMNQAGDYLNDLLMDFDRAQRPTR